MKTENGKIIEATTKELFDIWLADDWAEFTSFENFVRYVEGTGATVTEVQGYGNPQTAMST